MLRSATSQKPSPKHNASGPRSPKRLTRSMLQFCFTRFSLQVARSSSCAITSLSKGSFRPPPRTTWSIAGQSIFKSTISLFSGWKLPRTCDCLTRLVNPQLFTPLPVEQVDDPDIATVAAIHTTEPTLIQLSTDDIRRLQRSNAYCKQIFASFDTDPRTC